MGKLSLLLVLSLAVVFGIHSLTVEQRANAIVENYVSYNSKAVARNINNSTMYLALRMLTDSTTWRTGYADVAMFGGSSSLSLCDTAIDSKKSIMLQCVSVCNRDTISSRLIIQQKLMPPAVHAAITAFGPLDQTIGGMYIDGEDHTDVVISSGPPAQYQKVASAGFFGISTGAPTFVNLHNGKIGGTDRTVSPFVDIAPAYPNNPKVIETDSPWPNGFPKTPDEAMGWPEGLLKSIAKSGANGSRYLRTESQIDSLKNGGFPLAGVTYIDVSPADTEWEYDHDNKLPENSSGIFVFHCETKTAFWNRISFPAPNSTFKGIMIFDKLFHLHLNVLGALVILTPYTVTNDSCPGNLDTFYSENAKEKTVALSTKIIEQFTGEHVPKIAGGWEQKFILKSWYED